MEHSQEVIRSQHTRWLGKAHLQGVRSTLVTRSADRTTLGETVRGILTTRSLVCQQIAIFPGALSGVKEGARRVIRFAIRKSAKRSQVDAEHLTGALCERVRAQLGESGIDVLWWAADASNSRKPHASEMPDLMQVKDLDCKPGLRSECLSRELKPAFLSRLSGELPATRWLVCHLGDEPRLSPAILSVCPGSPRRPI
jgi:hypothetical protein